MKIKDRLFCDQPLLDDRVIAAFRLFCSASIGAVYLIGGMGICTLISSVYYFAASIVSWNPLHCVIHDPLYTAIHALEFIFLSPLAYLVSRSLSEYVDDLRRNNQRIRDARNYGITGQTAQISGKASMLPGGQAASVETNSSTETELSVVNESDVEFITVGKECLLETKALSMSLLFAVVATHLIGRIIEPSVVSEGHSPVASTEKTINVTTSVEQPSPANPEITPTASSAVSVSPIKAVDLKTPNHDDSPDEDSPSAGISETEAYLGLGLLALLASIFFGLELLTSSLKSKALEAKLSRTVLNRHD